MNPIRLGTALILTGLLSLGIAAGELTPPAAPASTAGPDPRTPITAIPFSISSSGSYYLAGDLTGSSGITVSVSDVTIDLRGFTLRGTGVGSSDGILTSGAVDNITVLNGTVRNWGMMGVNLETADSSLVEGVRALDNVTDGIRMGTRGVVHRCRASDNGNFGINVGGSGTVTACVTQDNDEDGIEASSNCLIADNICSLNGDDGIRVDDDCTVRGNVCIDNGDTSTSGAGVYVEGDRNRVDGNECSENDRGIQLASTAEENLVVRNSAWNNGSTIADNIEDDGTDNIIGPEVGSAGSDLPWLNFSFFF